MVVVDSVVVVVGSAVVVVDLVVLVVGSVVVEEGEKAGKVVAGTSNSHEIPSCPR